jgi:hypothetical protein
MDPKVDLGAVVEKIACPCKDSNPGRPALWLCTFTLNKTVITILSVIPPQSEGAGVISYSILVCTSYLSCFLVNLICQPLCPLLHSLSA